MTNDRTPNQAEAGTWLNPMQVLERLIGKPEAISVAAGLQPKAAYNWRHANGDRRAGDIPGAAHMRALLDWARANGAPLTPAHLIYGASVAEIDALVARSADRSQERAA